jgi:hypothetical protein
MMAITRPMIVFGFEIFSNQVINRAMGMTLFYFSPGAP